MAVVGAGLAGLAAGAQLEKCGAAVTVFEAQNRVGGRVLTIRDGFVGGQHAEAGGDFIDDGHQEIIRLAKQLGLTLSPILRQGFAFVRSSRGGSMPKPFRSDRAWTRLTQALAPLVERYRWSEQRWDGVVARQLASLSVHDWMTRAALDGDLKSILTGLRGFFLADPADLSLLALVDQVASGTPGRGGMYRIREGNDRLTGALAARLRRPVQKRHEVLALSQMNRKVVLRVRRPNGQEVSIPVDCAVMTVPAGRLLSMEWSPPIPPKQHAAIAQLRYGPVTKTLLQFDHRYWRRRGRPLAYGTDSPTGAVWDGNEEQKGRLGILCLMAGGSASADTQAILAAEGPEGLLQRLQWLGGSHAALQAWHTTTWEQDPWAGGGYAVFGPRYDPSLREWLARPHGRILFAGEHTSLRWQGYMNGAVESGLRAAAEVQALAWLNRVSGADF